MQSTDSPAPHGGAAPADRQCQFTKSDGFRCRDWAVRGHQHCFRHHQFLHSHPENPIDVPLLEDEDSLASLLSQTLRALAWGTLPTANGRAILAGCRIMQGILTHRLDTAKFHVRLARLGMTDAEGELLDRLPPTETEADPAPVPSHPQPVTSNSKPVTCNPQPVTSDSQPVTSNPQPVTSNPTLRFPNLKKEWDEGLRIIEKDLSAWCLPDRDKALDPFTIPRGVAFTAPTPEQLAAAYGR
ncbi:MAG TPA: hypothetical protein VHZ25_18775 [Acidobacteriaceae bacterium]|jgi:hypothetical protein|nr:hypothetical protein [Acidobacteriaceae bacterium]